MKKIYQLLILSNLLLIVLTEVPYPNHIDDRNGMNKNKVNQRNISDECYEDIELVYGIGSDVSTVNKKDPLRSNNKQNCDGPSDQNTSMKHWENADRHSYENHQKIMLYIIKYILGYSKHYQEIANYYLTFYDQDGANGNVNNGNKSPEGNFANYKFSKNPRCHKAAKRVNDNGFKFRSRAQAYYYEVNRKVNFLQNTRRGFYCTICDGDSKQAFGNYRYFLRWIKVETIHYDMDFCRDLIDNVADIVYSIHHDLQGYLKELLHLMTCVGDSNATSGNNQQGGNITVSEQFKQIMDYPLGSTNNIRINLCTQFPSSNSKISLFCLWFCNKWRYTSFSGIFDQNIKYAYKMYEFLKTKQKYLINENANIFNSDMANLQTTIEEAYNSVINSKKFFESVGKQGNFQNYGSMFNFLFYGIHPLNNAENSGYHFQWKSAFNTNISLLLIGFFIVINFIF